MPIALTTNQQNAIEAGSAVLRKFIWCDALDPDDNTPSPAGFFNDVGTVSVGGKIYNGSGTVIDVEGLPATSNFTIQGISVTLSGLDPSTISLVKGSTVGQRPIEVDWGIFDPSTMALIDGLVPYFRGTVDDIKIIVPEEGGNSTIELLCESTSRALTFSDTATRSRSSQRLRDPNDKIYNYTNMAGLLPVYFGRSGPK